MYKNILVIALLFTPLWAFADNTDLVLSQRPEAYGRSLCHQPGLHCIAVNPGDTWERKFPDSEQRNIVERLNRTNVPISFRRWLVVPKSWDHLNYNELGPFIGKIDPPGQKLLIVDLRVFAFAAYDASGNLVYWGPATGGDQWCSDSDNNCMTAQGNFKIYRIQGADCVSHQFPLETESGLKGGSPMPYCMHYYRGYALHGANLAGFTNRSHGCIHLFNADAKWLKENFVELGTQIMVTR